MVKAKINEEMERDFCEQIAEWQKNPDFIRAAREFIRLTTS